VADTPVVATAGLAPPAGYGGPTTNFNQTVTALVSRTIQENLRKVVRYLGAGGFIEGNLIPGTNLVRYIAYGDLSIPSPLLPAVQGTPPWLKEGIRPDLEPLTIGYDEFGVSQAGRLVGISDVALAYSPHQLMAVAAERVGFNALQTVDNVIAATLHAGTNIIWPTGTANDAALTTSVKLTTVELRRAVARLKAANVPTFPDGTYHAFIHPNLMFDLQDPSAAGGWIEAAKYTTPELIMSGEVGRLYGVRFIETPVGTDRGLGGVGGTVPIYSTFIFGPDAYAYGDLQDIRTYTVQPGGDHQDPLAQLAEVGWKAMFGAKLLTAVGTKYVIIHTSATAV
jgi:N4-gp56 family major capsid protein